MDEKDYDRLIPVNEAAQHLGISVSTLLRYEKRGLLKSLRTAGSHRRFRVGDLEDFREKMSSGDFIPQKGRPGKGKFEQLRLDLFGR